MIHYKLKDLIKYHYGFLTGPGIERIKSHIDQCEKCHKIYTNFLAAKENFVLYTQKKEKKQQAYQSTFTSFRLKYLIGYSPDKKLSLFEILKMNYKWAGAITCIFIFIFLLLRWNTSDREITIIRQIVGRVTIKQNGTYIDPHENLKLKNHQIINTDINSELSIRQPDLFIKLYEKSEFKIEDIESSDQNRYEMVSGKIMYIYHNPVKKKKIIINVYDYDVCITGTALDIQVINSKKYKINLYEGNIEIKLKIAEKHWYLKGPKTAILTNKKMYVDQIEKHKLLEIEPLLNEVKLSIQSNNINNEVKEKKQEIIPEVMMNLQNWRLRVQKSKRYYRAFQNNNIILSCTNGTIYKISTTGKIVWQVNIGSPVESSPVIYDHYIYQNSLDGYLYKINTRGGITAKIQTGPFIYSDMIKDNRSLIGINSDGYFCKIDNNICDKIKLDMFDIYAPVLKKDNLLFVGSLNNLLYCVNMDKKKIEWQYNCNGKIKSIRPIEAGQLIIIVDDDKNILAINKNRKLIWSHRDIFDKQSNPMIWNKKLLVLNKQKHLQSINLKNGKIEQKDIIKESIKKYIAFHDYIVYSNLNDQLKIYINKIKKRIIFDKIKIKDMFNYKNKIYIISKKDILIEYSVSKNSDIYSLLTEDK